MHATGRLTREVRWRVCTVQVAFGRRFCTLGFSAWSALYTDDIVWTGLCTLGAADTVQTPSGAAPPVRKPLAASSGHCTKSLSNDPPSAQSPRPPPPGTVQTPSGTTLPVRKAVMQVPAPLVEIRQSAFVASGRISCSFLVSQTVPSPLGPSRQERRRCERHCACKHAGL